MIHWIIFRALRPSWTSLRDKLAAVVLLARRLKAASPDALHPGKAGEESEGESLLSHRIFPAFLGQKPTSFRLPKLQADVAAFFPGSLFAKYGSRGFNPLAQVWGPKRLENLPLGWFSAEGPKRPENVPVAHFQWRPGGSPGCCQARNQVGWM